MAGISSTNDQFFRRVWKETDWFGISAAIATRPLPIHVRSRTPFHSPSSLRNINTDRVQHSYGRSSGHSAVADDPSHDMMKTDGKTRAPRSLPVFGTRRQFDDENITMNGGLHSFPRNFVASMTHRVPRRAGRLQPKMQPMYCTVLRADGMYGVSSDIRRYRYRSIHYHQPGYGPFSRYHRCGGPAATT